MDEFETDESKPTSKRGLVIALVALIVVIAIGFVAYNALSGKPQSTSASPQAATEASQASGSASEASAESSSAEQTSTEELPKLADYDVTIYNEYGDARTLTQLADGKPFVMNFWATWCPYCIQEMSDYQALVDEYDGRVSFAFIDIADGSRETVKDAAQWLFDNGYTLPSYYDTTLEAMYTYGAQSLPTTVIVAANGDIMDISPGAIDPDLMRSALDSLLEDAQANSSSSSSEKE